MPEKNLFTDLLPEQNHFLDGEYFLSGDPKVHQLHTASIGDLQRGEYLLETDFGHARYAVLAGPNYLVDWGSYALRPGLSYAVQLNKPFVEMHFQLQGSVSTSDRSIYPFYRLDSGETNLVCMPPGNSEFEIDVDNRGSVFEIQFAPAYFTGLAERYPNLFGRFLDRLLGGKGFFMSEVPLRMTPAMWSIIERIRERGAGDAVGSLFLESQTLELLALQFEQLDEPALRPDRKATQVEAEKIHAARDLLLARLADPPSLAELARDVGTNEFYLKRGFKELFGTSPYAYLLDHKLELARSLLLDTDLAVAQIAYRVGYSDPAHLTNAFRKKYGHPPSDLRRPRNQSGGER